MMELIPGVLNWSYHRLFRDHWDKGLDVYIDKVATLATRYSFSPMSITIGVGGDQNQLAQHDRAYVETIKQRLDTAGLVPVPILGNLEIHAEPQVVRKSLEQMKSSLEIASWWSTKVSTYNISVHGRLTRGAAVRVYTEALALFADSAREYGQQVCSENYNQLTSTELLAVVEGTGRPNVGILNDVGNWLILGEDPLDVTRHLASRTIHAHLKDYLLRDGVWNSVPLGRGIVPLPEILTVLADIAGDGPLVMALETDLDSGDEDAALNSSASYIRQWLDTAGHGVAGRA